jgi:hypothetical protein
MSLFKTRFSLEMLSQFSNGEHVASQKAALKKIESRCFRTTGDGCIALERDWPGFLEKARFLGKVAVQTRHVAARMIAVQVMPAFLWRADQRWMSDAEGVFHFTFDQWGEATCQLTPCECCGSFGRINACNRNGREFLQMCAVADSELVAWGGFLDAMAATSGAPSLVSHVSDFSPDADASPEAWLADLPRLPGDVEWGTAGAGDFAGIVEVLQHEKLPVRWTLRAAEFCNSRVFAPRSHEFANGGRVLSVRGAAAETVQLGLPMVRALAVGAHAANRPLHVAGPDGARLLTVSAADGREEAGLWRVIMKNHFPEISGD